MRRKFKLWKLLCVFSIAFLMPDRADAQTVGVSTNALGWATLSPNIGVEVGFAGNWSVSLDGLINPFTYSNGRKSNLWMVQPEVRYWPRHKFAGHVFGIHGQYGQYDWSMCKMGYRGDLKGGGISYGYAYMFHRKWNVEGTIGFGYNRLDFINRYDPFDPQSCFGPSSFNYWGITRIGIKFTYFIK